MCFIYKSQAACGDFVPEEFVHCAEHLADRPCGIEEASRFVEDVCQTCSWSAYLRLFLLALAISISCVLVIQNCGQVWPIAILLVICLVALDHFDMF
jgi:hypothetical protein